MKKLVILIGGALFATAVYASCTYQTITTPSGRVVTCTTCCYGGFCNTTCN